MSASTARHYWISGRVQGVYYRASAVNEARRLGLRGWVRNLSDGRVEAVAAGDDEALAEFERWLWLGPPQASVTEVLAEPAEPPQVADFSTRPTPAPG